MRKPRAEWPHRESWHGTDDYENYGIDGTGSVGSLERDDYIRVMIYAPNGEAAIKETSRYAIGFVPTNDWKVR